MKKVFSLFMLFFGCYSYSQLTIDNTTRTPAQLVQNVLVGAGVTPINIKFNGSEANAQIIMDQVAEFSTSSQPTNLGLDNGMLLTTGNAKVALGPNNLHNKTIATSNPKVGDFDLELLSDQNIKNVAVLEFDFVATGPVLKFDFIFASEEYPEFVYGFNDSFGFFLSGPGISGNFSGGAKNIALIPSTAIPISINTINNGLNNVGTCNNCDYYYNNTNVGMNPTAPGSLLTTQYDGFTKGLSANAELLCGETYHIKLAIGNALDNYFDSAVFLKNFSISPLELVDAFGNTSIHGCLGSHSIFSGISPLNKTFIWTHNGVVLPLETSPNITINQEGVYVLKVYNNNGCLLATDDIDVAFNNFSFSQPEDISICVIPANNYEFNINQNSLVLNGLNVDDFIIVYHKESPTGEIIPSNTLANYTSQGQGEQICMEIKDKRENGCTSYVYFSLNTTHPPLGNISYSSPNYCINNLNEYQPNLSNTIAGGYFSSTPEGLSLNSETGLIKPSLSITGNYLVKYKISATATCPASEIETSINITPEIVPTLTCSETTLNTITFTWLEIPQATSYKYFYQVNNNLEVNIGNIGNNLSYTINNLNPGDTVTFSVLPISNTEACFAKATQICSTDTCDSLAAPIVTVMAPYCLHDTPESLSAIGENLRWYTQPTGGIGTAIAPTPALTEVGTTKYYVSQTVSTCESPRAEITIVVIERPAAPTISSNNVYCQNSIIESLVATGSNLKWYLVPTGGNPLLSAPIPNTAVPGRINYYVSQSISGCESPRTIVPVTITEITPPPSVINNITYCQFSNAAPLTATGENLKWYRDETSLTNTTIAPIPDTTIAGVQKYYVTQTINYCESIRIAVAVNVIERPQKPVCNEIAAYCLNEVASQLVANGSNLLWYAEATGGEGSNIAPTPVTSVAGTTNYYVSQTVNGCESLRSQISIRVYEVSPPPIINGNPIYCQGNLATPLSVTGENLLWYADANGQTAGSTTPYIPNTAIPGVVKVYVSQNTTGCESVKKEILITIVNKPDAPIVTSLVTYCQNETPRTLTAIGSNILWYSSAFEGIGSHIPPTPVTAIAGETIYYVSQTINGCESARTKITVTVFSTPSAPVVTEKLFYCEDNLATPLEAIGTNLLWYVNATGGIGNRNAPLPDTSIIGSKNYYVTQTISGCESPRAKITVKVIATPNPILKEGSICIDADGNILEEYLLDSGLDNTNYTFEWYKKTNGIHTLIVGQENASIYITEGGEYSVMVKTNTEKTCASNLISVQITEMPIPVDFTITTSEYFADLHTITITNVVPADGSYLYQLDGNGFQSSPIFNDVTPGEHLVEVSDINSCSIIEKRTVIIDYPRFFTPNGDGYHDNWNIKDFEGQKIRKIAIFDSMGKLIKEIRPGEEGWQGNYNGRELPPADYWFLVDYVEKEEVKQFRSHFSLKR